MRPWNETKSGAAKLNQLTWMKKEKLLIYSVLVGNSTWQLMIRYP